MITDEMMRQAREFLSVYSASVGMNGLVLSARYLRMDGRGYYRAQGQANEEGLRAILRHVAKYNQDIYRALPF